MSGKVYGKCSVCDDEAIGLNFGVPTCMPCKAFFRRNAYRCNSGKVVCKNGGDCQVTYKHRRGCNTCRLQKCFRVGMQKELILSDEQREQRNKLVQENRLRRGKVPKQACIKWMQSPSLIRMPSNTIRCLSSSDQIAIANIFNTYENTCIAIRNSQYPCFPSVVHKSLHEFLNDISNKFPVFIEYFKHIPEFASIPIDDKIRLIKAHFGIMINVNESLMYPVTSNNLIATWTNVFGVDLTLRLLKRNQILEQHFIDPILLKLVLIILVLTSHNSTDPNTFDLDMICDDSLSIFFAQTTYVELLWNYILSRSTTYRDAVKFYNKLIICLLYITNLDRDIIIYVSKNTVEMKKVSPILQSIWPNPNSEINDSTAIL